MLLAASLDPGVAVIALDDFVGDEIDILLDQRILEPAPDQALDGEEGILGVGDRLALGGLTDQPLAAFGEGDHRGRRAGALGILDDLGRLALHDGNAGIRGTEIDADNFAHVVPLVGSRAARPLWAPRYPLGV